MFVEGSHGVLSIPARLRRNASLRGGALAVTFLQEGLVEERHLTYAELDQKAGALARFLLRELSPGDRVLLLYPPGVDYVVSFYACLYAGLVAVPAYPPRINRHLDRVTRLVRDCDARMALSQTKTFQGISRIAAEETTFAGLRWLCTDAEAWDGDSGELPPIDADHLAFLQYTSGSTSDPKGVMISHRNLVHNFAVIDESMGCTPDDTAVFWLPPYHDMGLVGGILYPLNVGLHTVLLPPVAFLKRPIEWLQAITRYRGTVTGVPNFALDLCVSRVRDEEMESLDLSSLEILFCGAEPIRARSFDRFQEKFGPAGLKAKARFACYGLAEATLMASGDRRGSDVCTLELSPSAFQRHEISEYDGEDAVRVVACGLVGSSLRAAIVEPESRRPSPEGTIGELWLSGPSVAEGYWRRDDLNDAVFGATLDGDEETRYLRTGDLGFIRDRRLYITGRLKEVMILRGRNYYPQDIEALVEDVHPALRKNGGAAFSRSVSGEEQLFLMWELERRRERSHEDVAAAIRHVLAASLELAVGGILFVSQGVVPKTTSGKIQRLRCRELYGSEELKVLYRWPEAGHSHDRHEASVHAIPPANAQSDDITFEILQAWLVAQIAKILKMDPKTLDPHVPLTYHGMDSVGAVTLVGEMEDRFGHRVDPMILYEHPCIDALARHLCSRTEIVEAFEKRLSLSELSRSITYRGGENFNLMDFMISTRKEPFLQRAASLSSSFESYLEGPISLYKRRVLGPAERAVAVMDPAQGTPREMLMFGSNNYLGLANHPYVRQEVKKAIDAYGVGLGGAPLLSGYTQLHCALEERLADIKGTESALLFSTGYSANVGLVTATTLGNALIVCDEYSHASFVDGIKMSGTRYVLFRHNDVAHLESLLLENRGRASDVFVGVEGLYSMDGDLAPLDRIVSVCRKFGAVLMMDDAHATGVIGATGQGAAERFGVKGQVEITMGTLSKTLAVLGGFIAASKPIVDSFRLISRSYMFSTSMPPIVVAGALAGLDVIEDEPERLERLRRNIRYLKHGLERIGITVHRDHESPIVAVLTPPAMSIRKAALHFHRRGIFVNSIEYPAVPLNQQRFRISLMATHTRADLDELLGVIEEVWELYGSAHVGAGSGERVGAHGQ